MPQSAWLTDVARCNPQPDSLFMNDLKTDLPGKVVFLKTGEDCCANDDGDEDDGNEYGRSRG